MGKIGGNGKRGKPTVENLEGSLQTRSRSKPLSLKASTVPSIVIDYSTNP